MTIYATSNGSKPRYDGGGTEFGLAHRDLGPGYLMFDIDRMSAIVQVELELKRENETFTEYRHEENNVIRWIAVFEVKANKTQKSTEALDTSSSVSIARVDFARRLECRLFVVFATNGKNPFEFWEYLNGEFQLVGTLDYENEIYRPAAVKYFWNNTLRIARR